MNETTTGNLIVLTNLLDADDLHLIQEESLKRNFFYSLHCINKLGADKVEKLLQNHTFVNISENVQSLAELIVNAYIRNFKESLFATLAHEFNILVEDRVIDDNLSVFIADITNDAEWQEYFFDKYPVVEKLLESTVDNALRFTLQFLNDLDQDYDEVSSTFRIDLRDFVTLELSISDNHNNQSGVVKMIFASKSVYYKPRSLQPENKIYRFFSFVQEFGLKKSIYIPKVISRQSHGWMEGVDFQTVETKAELLEFYQNQGVNLALFYFLGVADLIGDNIIAKGTLPCYFDLECILQPDIDDLDIDLFELNSYAAKWVRTSVLRTNLLPQYGFVTHEFQGISVSGLSYVDGSYPEMKIENSDGQFKRHYENTAFSHKNLHLPVADFTLESEIYVPPILEGFSKAYQTVMKYQKEISEYITDHFSHIKIRILYRPTYIYSKLLTESYLPYYLTDYSNRNTLFSSLRNLESVFLQNAPVIDSEIAQLEGQDIPIFYGSSQSRDIKSNKEILQSNYFNISGLEAALERIKSASDEDLRSQTELINLSFSIHEGYDLKNNLYKGKDYDIENSGTDIVPSTINTIKNQIDRIFEKILEKTDNSKKDFSAWSLFQTPNYTWDISSVKWGLFDGLDGLSFFYLNLYKVLGNQKALDIGTYYLEKGLQQFDQYEELYAGRTAFNKVSLFNYPVSTFYVAEYYIQSGISLNLPDRLINKLVKWITDYYTDDKDYDLVSGGAGTIFYLLKLYERLPSENLLELAENIASHIINGAVRIDDDKICWVTEFGKAHTGLSHGSSGIALALLKLYTYRKPDWLQREAVKALEYERSMYDSENKYWYTFKLLHQDMNIKAEKHFWAYGSAGILLCRLLLSDYYQDDLFEHEIEVAKKNVLSKGYMTNFNYSSGFIGNLDVLNEYSLSRNDHDLKQKLLSVAEKIAEERADFDEWSCVPFGKGNRSSIEMIGLFTGISGIGNTLLNLIDDKNLSNKLFR